MKKMVLFNVTPINTDVTDLQLFEEKVIKAKEMGATHILVTETIKNRHTWEEDLSDPYPNWGMLNSSLFKIILPDILKGFIPEEYANTNLKLVQERSKILKKYNLKAWAYFCEPFYLPEAFYRAHPSWRGPRCDHPRRARRAYYSPCMDNPEVLAVYKESIRKICDIADIDYLYLHTNDCGAGICWSNGLYDGPNGPDSCKSIPMSERILNYFRIFKEGAKESSRDLYIETNAKIGAKKIDPEMENIYKSLDDNMAVNFKTNKGTPLSSLIDLNYEFTIAPVKKIMQPILLLDQLEKAFKEDTEILRFVYIDDEFDIIRRVYKEFLTNPTNGPFDKMKLLNNVAKDLVGEKSQKLLEAWIFIKEGLEHLYTTRMEGFTWVSINQRLLTRPFVLNQDELTENEKSYYQKFQFQATSIENSYDLLNNQGSAFIKGFYCVNLASRELDLAINSLENAISIFNNLKDRDRNFITTIDRIKLLQCFIKNYQNAMNFQELVDETDFTIKPIITSIWPDNGDERLQRFESLNRKEIDNTYEIISLIKNREKEMLSLASKDEEEDIFLLPPSIVEQLNKKIEIMQNHELDGKLYYRSRNL